MVALPTNSPRGIYLLLHHPPLKGRRRRRMARKGRERKAFLMRNPFEESPTSPFHFSLEMASYFPCSASAA